jgi:glycosyltransferase involved in cell wall biosynthesis
MRVRLTDGNPEAPLLIYVGRLGMEKRFRDLKDVLARLPAARLAVVGKGPDMEALQVQFDPTQLEARTETLAWFLLRPYLTA